MFKLFIMICILFSYELGAKYVKGYVKSSGNYVAGYHRTKANYSKYDNYSSHGNINPYTGKKGYGR